MRGFDPANNPTAAAQITAALRQYAETIKPWADSVSKAMLADVARRDAAMWRKASSTLALHLRKELESAPTGAALRALQQSQVELIRSIPLEAAERVHKLAEGALLSSGRAKELAADILRTQDVTESRAMLIARTEVARASSNLVQVRAQHAGSDGYIWRTSEDSDVRESHDKMEGKYVRWAHPPTLDNLTGHAGALPNCRCFAEPVFPDE